MRLPAAMLRHRITVEVYLGATATGPRYGPPTEVPAYVESGTSVRRTPEGRVTVSTTKAFIQLDHRLTPEARVTVRGRLAESVSVDHLESRLGTPDHTVVTVQ